MQRIDGRRGGWDKGRRVECRLTQHGTGHKHRNSKHASSALNALLGISSVTLPPINLWITKLLCTGIAVSKLQLGAILLLQDITGQLDRFLCTAKRSLVSKSPVAIIVDD